MEGDRTFLALGVEDAEAGVNVGGGAGRQGALGQVNADRSNRRVAGVERDDEVFAFSDALGHLDRGSGCESDGGGDSDDCILGSRLLGGRSRIGIHGRFFGRRGGRCSLVE